MLLPVLNDLQVGSWFGHLYKHDRMYLQGLCKVGDEAVRVLHVAGLSRNLLSAQLTCLQ